MQKLANVVATILVLAAAPIEAQDARRVLQSAAETLGVTNMTSIQYSGTGWIGAVGQNFAPAEDWPRFELANYTRTIDFGTGSSKEEMVIRQGSYSTRGGGGAPIQGEQRRTLLVSGTRAWNIEGDTVIPMPNIAEQRMLEIMYRITVSALRFQNK